MQNCSELFFLFKCSQSPSKILVQGFILTEVPQFYLNFRRLVGFSEAVVRRCSVKKVLLEISQNSQENTCAKASFFIRKETLAQVFSSEFCKILKNVFFYRNLRWLLLDFLLILGTIIIQNLALLMTTSSFSSTKLISKH